MERLTFEHEGKKCFYCGDEDGSGCECKVCSGGCAVCNPCPVEQTVIDRLAAYEATGLTPEEIERILDAYGRGMTLRTENAERLQLVKDISTDRLKELAQADQDGRLVVLPGGDNDAVLAAVFRGEKPVVMHGGGDIDDLIALTHVLVSYAAETLGSGYTDFCWRLGEMPPTTDFKPAKEAEAAVERKEVNDDA